MKEEIPTRQIQAEVPGNMYFTAIEARIFFFEKKNFVQDPYDLTPECPETRVQVCRNKPFM